PVRPSRRFLPLRFGRKPLACPGAKGFCVSPIHADHRAVAMLYQIHGFPLPGSHALVGAEKGSILGRRAFVEIDGKRVEPDTMGRTLILQRLHAVHTRVNRLASPTAVCASESILNSPAEISTIGVSATGVRNDLDFLRRSS